MDEDDEPEAVGSFRFFPAVIVAFEEAGIDVRAIYWQFYMLDAGDGPELVITTADGPRHVQKVSLSDDGNTITVALEDQLNVAAKIDEAT